MKNTINGIKYLLYVMWFLMVHYFALSNLVDRIDAWVLTKYGFDYGTAKASVYLNKASESILLKELKPINPK